MTVTRYFTPKCRYKTAWYSIRPPVSTHDFQAVKFGGSKGGPGASEASWGGSGCHGAKAGCRALKDGSGKEGEPKASGAERAGTIRLSPSIIESAPYKTGGGYWTRSDEFCEYS